MDGLDPTATAAPPEESQPASGDGTGPGDAAPEHGLPRGATVSRYLIVGELGRGAMGVVYSAYDPELDRRVALKLLSPEVAGRSSNAAPRLLREAQALARLADPNVVAVHDAGFDDEQLFLAMELVEGETLRRWLSAPDRPWREVVDILRQAARGLAAAHRAGIVHRDFKPDNVVVGADGRVRVMDFGLARGESGESGESGEGASRPETHDEALRMADGGTALEAELTRAGTIVGTPAYMAPEQHLGAATDARTDQFAFCVVLYEGLYGRRPFAGGGLAALAEQVLHGDVLPPPRESKVPTWLRRVALRGLATSPEDRFADMPAVIEQLDRGLASGRRATWLGGAAVVLAGVGAWGLLPGDEAELPCRDASDRLGGAWDEPRRDAVHQALQRTGVGFAPDTAWRVRDSLDAYAADWAAEYSDACEATRVRGEQSAALLDARMVCLDGRRLELDAVTRVLRDADAATAERALAMVAALPQLAPCADLEYVRAAVPPPSDPQTAQRVETLDERRAESAALRRAGKFEAALAIAREVASEAEGVDYPPLRARAQLELGQALRDTAHYEDAAAALERAFFASQRLGLDVTAREAALRLVIAVGINRAQRERGHEWAKHASAAVDRTGSEAARVALLSAQADLAAAQGRHEVALEHLQEALALHEARTSEPSTKTANLLSNLGIRMFDLERYGEAQAFHERALEIRRERLGPDHPAIAGALNNLANAHMAAARYDRALALQHEALDVWERSVGDDDVRTADSHNNIGAIHYYARRIDDAIASFKVALQIRERVMGPDHPAVAASLNNIGGMLRLQGELDESASMLRRAVQIREAKLPPGHPKLGQSLQSLAMTEVERGNLDAALSLLGRAGEITEASQGPRSVAMAQHLDDTGLLELERQRWEAAEGRFTTALEIMVEALGESHATVTRVRLNLALARLEGGDTEAADTDYRKAIETSRPQGEAAQFLLSQALVGYAKTRRRLGDGEAAVASAREALAIREAASAPESELAHARFALALALDDDPSQRGPAIESARRAHAAFARAHDDARAAEVQSWLAAHGEATND